jgi:hypothetical protein
MRSSLIRLAVIGVSPEYYPSFQLDVDISDDGFRGSGTFWVTIPEWQAFLSGLAECERIRNGEVTLGDMGEWDSYLALKSANSRGHFVVQYRLTHRETSLRGTFPLDMEFFGQMVSGFQRLDEVVANPQSRL